MSTDSKAIVRAVVRPADQMILAGDVKAIADRIKLMISGGSKLRDDEAMALAQYATATQLNPFLKECYYLPGVGPGPGIAGYRRQASEQLWYEAERAQVRGETVYFWFDHIKILEPNPPFFDPDKGDIQYRSVLHDSLTKNAWEQRILARMITLITQAKVDAAAAMAAAKELVGPEPTWSADAIVYGEETFGKQTRDGKPLTHEEKVRSDKWNRDERCMKRGEKWALKKRFNLNLPEPIGWEDVEIVDGVMMDVTEISSGNSSPSTIIGKLGYGNAQSPAPVDFDRPYPPDYLQTHLADMAIFYANEIKAGKIKPPAGNASNVIASMIDTTLEAGEIERHILMEYLTGFPSTKDLTPGMTTAVLKWLGVEKFGDVMPVESITECKDAYAAALKALQPQDYP